MFAYDVNIGAYMRFLGVGPDGKTHYRYYDEHDGAIRRCAFSAGAPVDHLIKLTDLGKIAELMLLGL